MLQEMRAAIRRIAHSIVWPRSGSTARRVSGGAGSFDQTNARLRAAMDELPEGLVLLDPDGRYIHWNRSYADIYRRSADHFQVGARMIDTLRVGIARGDYPESVGREEDWLSQRMSRLARAGERHEQKLADGRWIMIEERRMPDGCTIGLRIDITEMKSREASFRLLFENNPVPMFVYDRETFQLISANETARVHYGYSEVEIAAMTYRQIANLPEDFADQRGDAGQSEAAKHVRRNGSVIDVATFSRLFIYEGRPCVIVSAIDTTERNRSEAQIAFLARHDPLTHLPNRTLFRERLEMFCADSAVRDAGFALMLIDLDRFKAVNDTLGHATGDLLLQAVGDRLQQLSPAADMVARLGGDEFAILHRASDDSENAASFAQTVIDCLSHPYTIDGHELRIGASVGISRAPQDGEGPDVLLRRADLALYESKKQGGGRLTFFIDQFDEALQARRLLETDLRLALAEKQLRVHYQPIVDLKTGQPKCMEALVRWMHPVRGLIPPAEFISFAEEIGLICDIGAYVMQQACRDAATWPSHVKVAVNLSPVQFRRSNVLALVMSSLAASCLPSRRLEIEITEALLMEKSEATLSTLHALRGLGIGISMDDFGTGYSSLSYLRNFPFTKIKIDRSFVHGISTNSDSQAIVRAIVGLGESLGMDVTAEGIESEADLNYLRAAGCPEGQGYFFAKPGPVEDVRLASDEAGRCAA